MNDRLLVQVMVEVRAVISRYAVGRQPDIDDAIQAAAVALLQNEREVSEAAAASGVSFEAQAMMFVKDAARRELSKAKRETNKHFSLDAPMDEEDEDGGTFGANVIAKVARFDPEIMCDAHKVCHAVAAASERDTNIVIMTAEGLSADEIAAEVGATSWQVRKDRARIISEIRARMRL